MPVQARYAAKFTLPQWLLLFAVTAVLYVATAWVGTQLPYSPQNVTLFWLPTGVAVAVLLRFGNVMVCALFPAAIVANLITMPLSSAWHISLGNVLAPLFCSMALQHVGFRSDFSHRRDVAWFGIAAIGAMVLSASNGVLALWMHGAQMNFLNVWLTWWAGDAVGVLLAAPLLLTLSRDSFQHLKRRSKEVFGFLVLFALAHWYVFLAPSFLHMTFLLVSLAVWSAMRFGMTTTALAVIVSAAIASWATSHGMGPFGGGGGAHFLILWGYVLTLTVITLMIAALQAEHLRASNEVRDAYERISKVASRLPGVILQYRIYPNRSVNVPYASSAIEHVFELTLDEAQKNYSRLYERIAREDIEAGKASFVKAAAELNPWQHEFRLTRRDGTVRWLYIDALPEKEPDGAMLWHCFISDITERKQAEKDLQIAAYTFESQEGIFVTDANWRILRLNHAFTRITGFSSEDLVGKFPPMCKNREQDKAFFEHIGDSLKGHRFWQGELWAPKKNGQIYPQLITITAIADAQGEIINYIASFNDISRHKHYEEEIRNLAFYDPLTQLPNRRLLMDRLQHLISKHNRSISHSAILFIDLDNFKTINDTRGHDAGDLLLVETAKRLRACVRDSDTVARLGGDEFVVVLEELSSDPDEAVQQTDRIGNKIRRRLADAYPILDFEYHGSSSIGVTLFQGGESTVKDLFKRADTAMYEAKSSGRNALRFYDPAMQAVLLVRMMLESNLRVALSMNQLVLHYQVQVDQKGKIIGAEALLRWQHPERGMIMPVEFIPMAEETGLIVPIGFWVLETACAQIKRWESDPSTAHLVISVNVSAKQIQQSDFVGTVCDIVNKHQIDPSHLAIEITESTILDNVASAIEKMVELKKLGIVFSMDDFGTGYSSLAYLQRLPLNQLKIDKSFVRDISDDEGDATIVRAIISMGINLGLEVIAEGVETEAQFKFLTEHHCHAFQGYLFSQPLPQAEFEQVLMDAKAKDGQI
jgi:diguanylate cyclase (GGDEF)-like protein/PAS domain S-box-containing protein